MQTQKARISPSAMSEVRDAIKAYADAVQASELSLSSQATYVDHVNAFMRWLQYDFEPGSRKTPYARTKDRRDSTSLG
jgi:hypothetical protein